MENPQLSTIALRLLKISDLMVRDDDKIVAAQGRQLIDTAADLYARAGDHTQSEKCKEVVAKLRLLAKGSRRGVGGRAKRATTEREA